MTSRNPLPVLDNSAVSTFNQCPRKFYYNYVLHYQKPISAPLHFGRVWHKMLDVWYSTGGDETAAIVAGRTEWGDADFPNDHRTFQRCWEAFTKYVKEYSSKAEHDATFGLREGSPLVEIAVVQQWPEIPLQYVGKIDRVIRAIDGYVYVNDHKTVSRMDAAFFRGFEMASQMLGYTKLVSEFLGVRVMGVMVNAYNITPTGKTDKFVRQYIDLPEERVETWATKTLPDQMNAILRAYETDDWAMNHEACNGKYGLCSYFDVCTMPERRRASFLDLNFEIREWNPLAAD